VNTHDTLTSSHPSISQSSTVVPAQPPAAEVPSSPVNPLTFTLECTNTIKAILFKRLGAEKATQITELVGSSAICVASYIVLDKILPLISSVPKSVPQRMLYLLSRVAIIPLLASRFMQRPRKGDTLEWLHIGGWVFFTFLNAYRTLLQLTHSPLKH